MILMVFLSLTGCSPGKGRIQLAGNGSTPYIILLPPAPTPVESFAASELAGYLKHLSGATFKVETGLHSNGSHFIRLVRDTGQVADEYAILSGKHDITLKGNSDIALLYAVYDFLEMEGCRWLAPEFTYYHGYAQVVPTVNSLEFPANTSLLRRPAFAYRKVDVAEGKSTDVASLARMIDWMAKNRFNTLMVPMDLNHRGRTMWDNFRSLIPEIQKRGIILEVGQHGYQNFLNAGMEGGKLFVQHPEWFGKDEKGHPSADENMVFNIGDTAATHYFILGVLDFLAHHPEIDVFDLWPPDFARWNTGNGKPALSPELLQARLTGEVEKAVRNTFPSVRVETIAFAKTLKPVALPAPVMVDICPIGQNFEKQIFDTTCPQNRPYAREILEWRKAFPGDLGIYSYYRKYAWKSLPNIIPHYMQTDLQWYAGLPIQGMSCYAEPGDWSTYELNHFVLGKLEWNPNVDVDSLVNIFCQARYGESWESAAEAYALLEQTVRFYGNIKYSELKPAGEIRAANRKIRDTLDQIRGIMKNTGQVEMQSLSRLVLMLQYASLDLQIQEARASGMSGTPVTNLLEALRTFMEVNRDKGVVLYSGKEDLAYLTKHYRL